MVPTEQTKPKWSFKKTNLLEHIILMVGTNNKITTYCVEARVFPSGLNAAAIVDLGGGNNAQ